MSSLFIPGIDISSHQQHIDWAAIPKTEVSFAFARATIGAHAVDAQFVNNWKSINDAGLIRGAYHFFWPLSPWQDQADNFIAAVGKLVPRDLPPCLDLEEAYLKQDPGHDVWTDAPQNQVLSMILGWLQRVESALGVKPIVYTRQNFIENLLNDGVKSLAEHPLWIAQYTTASQPKLPPQWDSWAFWQYSEVGTVSGVSGNVDKDWFNGSMDDLKVLVKS
jgi:lysozyme